MAQRLKRLPAMWETWVQSLGREDTLEKEIATHSSGFLASFEKIESLSKSIGCTCGAVYFYTRADSSIDITCMALAET